MCVVVTMVVMVLQLVNMVVVVLTVGPRYDTLQLAGCVGSGTAAAMLGADSPVHRLSVDPTMVKRNMSQLGLLMDSMSL